MTRRYGGAPAPHTPRGGGWKGRRALPPPGVLAWFSGMCPRCDRAIVNAETLVTKRKDEWVCVGCGGAGE